MKHLPMPYKTKTTHYDGVTKLDVVRYKDYTTREKTHAVGVYLHNEEDLVDCYAVILDISSVLIGEGVLCRVVLKDNSYIFNTPVRLVIKEKTIVVVPEV